MFQFCSYYNYLNFAETTAKHHSQGTRVSRSRLTPPVRVTSRTIIRAAPLLLLPGLHARSIYHLVWVGS